MNKGFFAYCVTETHFSRLENSLIKQSQLCVTPEWLPVLITDNASNIIENFPLINKYFDSRVVTTDPWVEDKLYGKQFSLSKLRNVAINYALENNYDYCFLCDSDTVLTSNHVEVDHAHSSIMIPKVYWQKNEDETLEQSLEFIQKTEAPFSNGNSWFILPKSVLQNAKFNEAIFGYGYEDIEFWAKVESMFGPTKVLDYVVIHSFHHDHEKKIVPELFERNKFIFESCLKLVRSGFPSANLTYVMPVIKDDGRIFFQGPNVYLD